MGGALAAVTETLSLIYHGTVSHIMGLNLKNQSPSSHLQTAPDRLVILHSHQVGWAVLHKRLDVTCFLYI